MGNYTSPAQMRAELATVITDKAFLEKVVGDYFKDHEPAPLPKEAPIAGYRRKVPTVAAKNAILMEDETQAEMMERGSVMLGEAITTMLEGRVPATPSSLMWRRKSGLDHGAVDHPAPPEPVFAPLRYNAPCVRCGAAQECSHRPQL